MTHRIRRCKHCKITYNYQGSGPGCNEPTNNDTYCPICMELIHTALKPIKIKYKKESLPTMKNHRISIEIFKEKYKEYKSKQTVDITRLTWGAPTNYNNLYLTIDGLYYTLVTKDTGEELLLVDYSINKETNLIEDYWYDI